MADEFRIECVNCKATRASFTAMAHKYGGSLHECCVWTGYPEPPTLCFVDASGTKTYVRGISKAELAWHQSRRPKPVTGKAHQTSPEHYEGDVIRQLQEEEEDEPRR